MNVWEPEGAYAPRLSPRAEASQHTTAPRRVHDGCDPDAGLIHLLTHHSALAITLVPGYP